jgi:bifunctional NMN adenylyltransferase/nudix hydrolase
MTKKYDVIVFIGRFQPFHNAHLEIIKRAMGLAEHTAIIVGSANQPRTFKNPFSYGEREHLIDETLMMMNADYSIHPIQDTIYNNLTWATRVQNIVNQINPSEDIKVGIIGYKKDASSFYLDMFPQWDLIEVPLIEELSASQIRELYFKEDYNPNFIKSVVPAEVLEHLNTFSKTEDYDQILREIDFVEKYKSQYASFPYPPTFVTVDAVLVQSGHILMIRRRAEPGKGLLALPGGFLDALSDKSLEDAMIREVREETQLKVPGPVLRGSIVEAKVFDAIERSTRGRTITHAFHINLPNGELPKVKGGSDATSAKWIPISKITPNECFEDHYEIINYFTGV